jgi:DNA modification methylase
MENHPMNVIIFVDDCLSRLKHMPDQSVHTIITSPPYYGLRNYGHDGQIGLESSYQEFVAKLVEVFSEARRVLRDDGTLWLNLGDTYVAPGAGGQGASGQMADRSVSLARGKNITRGSGRWGGGQTKRSGNLKPKDLIGIPWRVALALQDDGWYLRQDIIWAKPNPMPESVTDRCTKSHEYIFLLSKGPRYYFDADAIMEPISTSSIARLSQDVASQAGSDRVPGKTNGSMKAVSRRSGNLERKQRPDASDSHQGSQAGSVPWEGSMRNKRSVWNVSTKPFSEAHFATYPPDLIAPCVLAGCPQGGTVLDPFFGAGTTGMVANRLQRNCIGIELNPEYAAIAEKRLRDDAGMLININVK